MVDYDSRIQHAGKVCAYWTDGAKKDHWMFRSTATLIAEGIEDHTRGEVENLTRAIEGNELLHMTFTRNGKRYRVEMREDE